MKNFMMIFRNEAPKEQPSPEQMQAMIKTWQDWIGGIAAQDKFVSTDALSFNGKTIHAGGVITDGPFAEVKEFVNGYLICKTTDLNDAMKLTEGCPALAMGGKVEVREVMVFDM